MSDVCECGSGLRRVRCCGLDGHAVVPLSATRHLVPLVEQAARAFDQGARDAAAQLCLDVLELAPDRCGALSILYEIRKTEGKLAAAESLLRRIVALDPNNFLAINELGLTLLNCGRLEEAEHHSRNAVRIAPENPQAHHLLAMVLTESNRPQFGEYHYRRALELSGTRDPIVMANLAWSLKNQGKMEEARALYEESLAAAPEIRQTLLGFARLEEADRDFAAAARLIDLLDGIAPGDVSVTLTRAVLAGRTERYDEALNLLESLIAGNDGTRLGPAELLEKGRLLDRLGRYDAAFEAYSEGKALGTELSGTSYRADRAENLVARLRRFFTAGRVGILPRAAVRADPPQPVFILGFPRSGTTLMEQSLSAHPRVCAGDELPIINDITGAMPRMLNSPMSYPEALAELWMADQREGLDNLRDYYLRKVRQMGVLKPGTDLFTDKMPLNETHLGLIALIFPRAPLIHLIRHPLDVMVSAISNLFTHGFHCGAALETAAQHYVLIMDLVQHYRNEMQLQYLAVRYEDMVGDQEGTVRSVLDFIGVEFDPACLNFHENRRYARTASYAQVTEKLYDRSRFRYRNYLRHLERVIPILRPTIERLGYTIE